LSRSCTPSPASSNVDVVPILYDVIVGIDLLLSAGDILVKGPSQNGSKDLCRLEIGKVVLSAHVVIVEQLNVLDFGPAFCVSDVREHGLVLSRRRVFEDGTAVVLHLDRDSNHMKNGSDLVLVRVVRIQLRPPRGTLGICPLEHLVGGLCQTGRERERHDRGHVGYHPVNPLVKGVTRRLLNVQRLLHRSIGMRVEQSTHFFLQVRE
jgi:hypothetical protein